MINMATARREIQDLTGNLFMEGRIVAAGAEAENDASGTYFSRRNFLKLPVAVGAGLVLGYAASKVSEAQYAGAKIGEGLAALGSRAQRVSESLEVAPPVYGADVLQIPKLSYNPTIVGELLSDYSLQQQILFFDGRSSFSAPVTGKIGFAFDDDKLDFVLDYTSVTSPPKSIFTNIAIDKINSKTKIPNKDMFFVANKWVFSPEEKTTYMKKGTEKGQFGPAEPLPQGFEWEFAFRGSYFEKKDHPILAARIPNSYIGPGGPDGTYGMYATITKDDSRFGPGFPPDGFTGASITYGSFRTEFPIPDLSQMAGPIGGILTFLTGIASRQLRKSRKS